MNANPQLSKIEHCLETSKGMPERLKQHSWMMVLSFELTKPPYAGARKGVLSADTQGQAEYIWWSSALSLSHPLGEHVIDTALAITFLQKSLCNISEHPPKKSIDWALIGPIWMVMLIRFDRPRLIDTKTCVYSDQSDGSILESRTVWKALHLCWARSNDSAASFWHLAYVYSQESERP